MNETIVAIATPPGRGGVGIVRVSGPLALSIAHHLSGEQNLIPRQMYYRFFHNVHAEILDKGLIVFFKAPYSFTGEDIVEFHAHGSPYLLDELVKACIACGARLARPGEFSERAYLNDKIDLVQAEAIADLIQASSLTAARMAARSLQGDFSKLIDVLSEKIVYLRMYVEAAIDFPEEEVDFLGDQNILDQLEEIKQNLESIQSLASQGVLLKEGLSIVIAGKPNAGKSTLINYFAGRDIAIVTDVAGTTRDVMRQEVLLDDLPVHFIDTAGLRESDDVIEQEGIRRAWEEVRKADCLLMLIDVHDQSSSDLIEQEIINKIPPQIPVLKVFNKIDKISDSLPLESNSFYISARHGTGIELLKEKIKEIVHFQPSEGQFIARRRHLDSLQRCYELLLEGKNELQRAKAGELLAENLRLAHLALCEITGEFSTDDLLGKIFSSFCIGK